MTNTRLSLRIGHILVKFRDAGLKLSKNTKHSILYNTKDCRTVEKTMYACYMLLGC